MPVEETAVVHELEAALWTMFVGIVPRFYQGDLHPAQLPTALRGGLLLFHGRLNAAFRAIKKFHR